MANSTLLSSNGRLLNLNGSVVAYKPMAMTSVMGFKHFSVKKGEYYGLFTLLDPEYTTGKKWFTCGTFGANMSAGCGLVFITSYSIISDTLKLNGVTGYVNSGISIDQSLAFPSSEQTVYQDGNSHHIGDDVTCKVNVIRTSWTIPATAKATLFIWMAASDGTISIPLVNYSTCCSVFIGNQSDNLAAILSKSAESKFSQSFTLGNGNVEIPGTILNGIEPTITKWNFK